MNTPITLPLATAGMNPATMLLVVWTSAGHSMNPPKKIEKEAGQHFINEIADRLEQGIDEGWDADQLQEVLKLMK